MGPDRNTHLRNFGIVLLLAVAVWRLPGGGTATDVIGNVLGIAFAAGLVFFAYRMYMENRMLLFDMPEQRRLLLYASATTLVFALVATGRFWNDNGPLILLWFALIGAAAYGFAVVIRTWREY